MAQEGTTGDGSDRAPVSRAEQTDAPLSSPSTAQPYPSLGDSPLPQSPWQPETQWHEVAPSADDEAMEWPAMGDVIDMNEPDDAVIDLGDVRDRHAPEPVRPLDPEPTIGGPRGGRFGGLRARTRRAVRHAHVIELGEHHGRVSRDAASAMPPWLRLDVRRHARPIAVVIVVLTALLVSSSVGPPPQRMPQIGSISLPLGASIAVDGARAVVLGSHDGVGESLAAYDVAGGDRDWFVGLPVRLSDDVGMTLTDGVVLISGGRLGRGGSHTVAVDEKTGKLLWSNRLNLVSPRRGSDTVLVSAGPNDQMAIDKRTGVRRWDLTLAPGCLTKLAVPADSEAPTALVELCVYASQIRRLDLDTGEQRASHPITLAAKQDVDVAMFTVDDVVLVQDHGVTMPMFDAYRLSDLAPLWSSRGFSTNDSGYPCGDQVCVSANGVTVVLDADTGEVMPAPPHSEQLTASVLQPPVPASAVGTLLLAAPGAQPPVADRSTYVATPVPDRTVKPVPLFRPGRTWVVTVNGAGVRDNVQLLDGPSADVCIAIGAYLGCMTSQQRMSFWRLPATR